MPPAGAPASPASAAPQHDDAEQHDEPGSVDAVGDDDERDGEDDGREEHADVDLPVIGDGDPGTVAKRDRQRDEGGDHDRVQDEDAGVEPQHLPVAQRAREPREGGPAGVRHPRGRRDPEVEQGDGQHRHRRGRPEQSGDTGGLRHHRAEDEGEGERGADARADERHHPGPVGFAGEIAGERHRRGCHRPHALQRASGHDSPDVVRERRDHAAEREDYEPGRDHRLAPEPIGEDAERHLEHPLGESVDADRDPDQQRRVSRILVCVDAEHGQEHEQPEHAEREDPRERGDRTALDR